MSLDIKTNLQNELKFLQQSNNNSILINNTAKMDMDFKVLPRRSLNEESISCFMINNEYLLKETLLYFDGKVEIIYIDIEQKQEINLYQIAKQLVTKSTLLTVKPNDITLESSDLLIRNHFDDDLYMKNVIVIGTGNLASKIAVRLAERQASVFIKGRTQSKEKKLVDGLNLFLPKYTQPIKSFEKFLAEEHASVVVSFLSGQFLEESIIHPIINEKTLVIDAGINNFSQTFIEKSIERHICIFRLDTRIALPYQFLLRDSYVQNFFTDVLGLSETDGVEVASGGFIGPEGTVIVNNIKSPNQIIGIADGSGGVKSNEQLNERDEQRIQTIKQSIS